jgi:hypothetical protein
MKNILKINAFLLALLIFSGCENWLDVNEDLNQPTVGRVDLLLPSAQIHMFTYLSGYQGASVGATIGTVMHQVKATGNSYNVTPTDHSINESWDAIYSGLQDVEEVIRIGKADDQLKYVGVAKLLKAYNYSLLVDLWGDVPFSEATSMPAIQYPSFEKGEDIYPALFDIIDDAILDLKNADSKNSVAMGTSDLVYEGNVDSWIKLANSLKLKMYNQIRLHASYDAAKVNALILEDNFIDSDSEFEIAYGSSKLPENRNPMYVGEYESAKDHEYLLSHWMFGTMNGDDKYISLFKDVKDPRIAYYYYKQEDGTSDEDVDFQNGDFYTTRFGSHGKDISTNFKNFTALGVYPCGGKFDDGSFTPGDFNASGAQGSGLAPMRLLSAHDILFIRAELADAGKTTENARDLFEAALNASFDKVNAVAKTVEKTPELKVLDRDAYIASILTKFDAGNILELIITEKWIASFGNPVDSYSDYRRTGFPKLYDPNTDDTDEATYTSYSFPVSMPYANSSMNANINKPEVRTISEDKVFWDAN